MSRRHERRPCEAMGRRVGCLEQLGQGWGLLACFLARVVSTACTVRLELDQDIRSPLESHDGICSHVIHEYGFESEKNHQQKSQDLRNISRTGRISGRVRKKHQHTMFPSALSAKSPPYRRKKLSDGRKQIQFLSLIHI